MKIVCAPHLRLSRPFALCGVVLMTLWLATGAAAQSTDIEFPTPVRTGEITGTIAPRDVGDSRLTRYFYSLTGTNGDLTVTVESRNLNGDVDLFTAGSLRPLTKLSMYAGDTAGSTSKTIYFKGLESLILRVEARSPNDDAGSFRIRFEGAFAPIAGEVQEPSPVASTTPQPDTTTRKTKRVTATGARIDEPVVETVEKAPEPKPSRTPRTEVAAREKTLETTQPSASETEPATPPTPKPSRTKRPRPPRATMRRTRPKPAPTTTAGNQPPTQPEQPTAAITTPPTTTTTPEPVNAGPRLIIETRDGLRVERYMTSVRRVTVENGQVIVVLKSGKTERQPMTNVLKMSIEP